MQIKKIPTLKDILEAQKAKLQVKKQIKEKIGEKEPTMEDLGYFSVALKSNTSIEFYNEKDKEYVSNILNSSIKLLNMEKTPMVEQIFADLLASTKITSNGVYFTKLQEDGYLLLTNMETGETKNIWFYGNLFDVDLGCTLSEVDKKDTTKNVQFGVIFKDGNYYIQPQDTLAKERMEISRTR